MAKIVKKQVSIDAKVNKVYKMISDQELHTEIAGSTVKIEKESGSSISLYKGVVKGKLLLLKPNKMIVFTCRMKTWKKEYHDAVCTLLFDNEDDGTANVSMIIVNVPDEAAAELTKILNENLWRKLKAYLKEL